MPQIGKAIHRLVFFLFLISIIWSCNSSSNSDSVFNSDTGHPSDWVEIHGVKFLGNPDVCMECHGDDLK